MPCLPHVTGDRLSTRWALATDRSTGITRSNSAIPTCRSRPLAEVAPPTLHRAPAARFAAGRVAVAAGRSARGSRPGRSRAAGGRRAASDALAHRAGGGPRDFGTGGPGCVALDGRALGCEEAAGVPSCDVPLSGAPARASVAISPRQGAGMERNSEPLTSTAKGENDRNRVLDGVVRRTSSQNPAGVSR